MPCQRVYAVSMGWEDCNDFDSLARDPLYTLALGSALALEPTLSRRENAVSPEDLDRMSGVLAEVSIDRNQAKAPKRIVLDINAPDDPTHGQQEFDFFSQLCDCHCYGRYWFSHLATGRRWRSWRRFFGLGVRTLARTPRAHSPNCRTDSRGAPGDRNSGSGGRRLLLGRVLRNVRRPGVEVSGLHRGQTRSFTGRRPV
jgi:hypothetical protein